MTCDQCDNKWNNRDTFKKEVIMYITFLHNMNVLNIENNELLIQLDNHSHYICT